MMSTDREGERARSLQARLQASQAALRELGVLREKHHAMIQDVKNSLNHKGKSSSTNVIRTNKESAGHSKPQQSASGCCHGQQGSSRTRCDPCCRITGTIDEGNHTDEIQNDDNDWPPCLHPPEHEIHRQINTMNGRDLVPSSTLSGMSSTFVACPSHRSMSQPSIQPHPHPSCPCCRGLQVTSRKGRRCYSEGSDYCNVSSPSENNTKAPPPPPWDFTAPRQFSRTTYSYPSPMHAVLLQYHWTRQTDDHTPDSLHQTSSVEHRGETTEACDLPFVFLSEQTKPENNCLHNLLQTSYSELAEDYDNFDSTPSMRTRDSSKSARVSLSSEEGYYSSSDSTTNMSNHVKRCSGQSDISFSSTGSDACSISSDNLTDLPSPSSIRSPRHTRISGMDDSWVDYLDQLSQMKDTFV